MIYYCTYTVDDCTVVCHDPEFEDKQKERIKARNVQSLDGAASYPRENHVLHSRSKPHTKEKIWTTTSNSGVSNSSGNNSKARSLPHMYGMIRSPSADDDDGNAWRYVNESYINYIATYV